MPSKPQNPKQPIETPDQARAVYQQSRRHDLESLSKAFEEAPDDVDYAGRQTTSVVTRREPHPNAFLQVPVGTVITATWPKL